MNDSVTMRIDAIEGCIKALVSDLESQYAELKGIVDEWVEERAVRMAMRRWWRRNPPTLEEARKKAHRSIWGESLDSTVYEATILGNHIVFWKHLLDLLSLDPDATCTLSSWRIEHLDPYLNPRE